jgi:hypothetical protein
MTPRAARIKAQREKRMAQVDKHNQQAVQEEARRKPLALTATEKAASALFRGLQDTERRSRAQQELIQAPDEVRAAVMKLLDTDSPFKKRRSHQRNGY